MWDYELEDNNNIIEESFDKLDDVAYSAIDHYYGNKVLHLIKDIVLAVKRDEGEGFSTVLTTNNILYTRAVKILEQEKVI